MKKILSLVLVLCMILTALPALADSAGSETGSGLENLLSGLLSGGDGTAEEGETGLLLSLISGLKNRLKAGDLRIPGILSALKSKLGSLLSSGKKGIGSIVSGLKEKLPGGGDFDLGGLIDGLLGSVEADPGDSGEEGTEELDLDIERTISDLNEAAEKEFGENVRGRKEAESIEEFYGLWVYSTMDFMGEEIDMSDSGEGAFIGEDTYYVTQDGKKSPDYIYPETAEMKLEQGVLKVLVGNLWVVHVLTEDGNMAEANGDITVYYTRAGE